VKALNRIGALLFALSVAWISVLLLKRGDAVSSNSVPALLALMAKQPNNRRKVFNRSRIAAQKAAEQDREACGREALRVASASFDRWEFMRAYSEEMRSGEDPRSKQAA
jgi:hypothetical protein